MLKYWLPLCGDLHNQGLDEVVVTNNGATANDNGKIGKCYYFDGNAHWLQLDRPLGDFYNNDFSLAVWLKPTDSTRSIILSEYSASGASNVAFELTTARVIRVYWNGSPDINATAAGGLTLNEWSHIAIVKTNGVIKFYINGVLKYTYAGTLSSRTSNANPRIGDDYRGGTGVSYQGYMNDFRLYSHALSPKEVKELSKGLVLHYPLNRGGFGQDNLSTNSGDLTKWNKESGVTCTWDSDKQMYKIQSTSTSSRWGIWQQVSCEPNTIYTFSVDGMNVDQTMYLSVGSMASGAWPGNHGAFTTKRNRLSYTWTTGSDHTIIRMYLAIYPTADGSKTGYYALPKLELGSTATPWIPNSADALYSDMGLDDGIEYDVSGYGNNGVINNYGGSVIISSETPRYLVSTNLHSENASSSAQVGSVWISGSCQLTTPKQLTICFWLKPMGGYGGQYGQGVFALTNNNSSATDYVTSPANQHDNKVRMNNVDGSSAVNPTMIFISNEWHHYAFTYDGKTAKSYRDGVLFNASAFSTETALGSCTELYIGLSRAGGVWRRNNNCYSDFRIYSTCLSPDDILSLYHTPTSIASNGTLLTQGEISEV